LAVSGLTFGHFSLLDLVEAVVAVTGPADVSVVAWSAGRADADRVRMLLGSGRFLSVRVIVGLRAESGHADPAYLVRLFGRDSVREIRSHAKFVTVSNPDGWRVAITSSMNLNQNRRCEHFELADEATRFGLFAGFVDEVFRGEFASVLRMPELPGLVGVPLGGSAGASLASELGRDLVLDLARSDASLGVGL
jgi:hypothetical protein